MDTKSREIVIARDELAGSDEPDRGSAVPMRRAPSSWKDTFFTAIVFALGAAVLTAVSFRSTRQDQSVEPASIGGAGIIIRSEPIHLWLPPALAELGHAPSESRLVRIHEELRRSLELEDRKDVWYALTVRGYQCNGEFIDTTVIRSPYDDARHFSELLAILATVAGNPRLDPDVDFSRASIHILAEDLVRHEPRAVMAELLGQ